MTTTTELKKLLFSMILKTPILLVHLAANQSSVMSIPKLSEDYKNYLHFRNKVEHKTKYSKSMYFNSLIATGDRGRQPPLLPPLLGATRVDTIIHNYRLSAPPQSNAICMDFPLSY